MTDTIVTSFDKDSGCEVDFLIDRLRAVGARRDSVINIVPYGDNFVIVVSNNCTTQDEAMAIVKNTVAAVING